LKPRLECLPIAILLKPTAQRGKTCGKMRVCFRSLERIITLALLIG
jgi:hypothetical protein